MKILHITTSFPIELADPTAPFIRSIADSLTSEGHEVLVLAPSRWGSSGPSRTDAGTGIKWVDYAPFRALSVIGHGLSLRNDRALRGATYLALPLYLVSTLMAARAVAQRWRPDAIHSHWVLPTGLIGALVARSLQVPHIIGLHGSDIYVARSNRLFSSAARIAFRGARQTVACSPYLATQAVALGAPASTVHYLPYGVDAQRFKCVRGDSRSGHRIVLAVGRLVEKKGFRQLVRCAPTFLARHPDAQLWIAGEGDDRATLEHEIATRCSEVADRIRLVGAVSWDKMPGLMAGAEIMVVPSVRAGGNEDGLPNVLLEAMAAGLPVVATDVGAVPNVITNGHNGLIVASGDELALAQAVSDLLGNHERADRLGAEGAQTVNSLFTWGAYARQLIGFYAPTTG